MAMMVGRALEAVGSFGVDAAAWGIRKTLKAIWKVFREAVLDPIRFYVSCGLAATGRALLRMARAVEGDTNADERHFQEISREDVQNMSQFWESVAKRAQADSEATHAENACLQELIAVQKDLRGPILANLEVTRQQLAESRQGCEAAVAAQKKLETEVATLRSQAVDVNGAAIKVLAGRNHRTIEVIRDGVDQIFARQQEAVKHLQFTSSQEQTEVWCQLNDMLQRDRGCVQEAVRMLCSTRPKMKENRLTCG